MAADKKDDGLEVKKHKAHNWQEHNKTVHHSFAQFEQETGYELDNLVPTTHKAVSMAARLKKLLRY